MSWLVDGNVMRTVHKADTYNATSKQYQFPQTPSKIQLSLWPAGNPTNPVGTRDWAGGIISWNTPYMTNGYYWVQVSEIDVQCYNTPTGANVTGSKSYIYTGLTGLENTVSLTNSGTTLGSLEASGDNPGYNPDAAANSSATASGASSTGTSSPNVPGAVGAGSRGGGDTSSGSSESGDGTSATVTTFIQGLLTTPGAKASNAAGEGLRDGAIHGSALAILVAIFALVVI